MSDIRAEVERWMRANASKATSGLTVAGNFAAKVKEVSFRAPDLVWTAPTFLNSWANFGGSWETAGYNIDDGGTVELRGLIKGGTPGATSAIFTLPVGFRPAADIIRSTLGNDSTNIAAARLSIIASTGNAIAETGPTPGASGWWTISGVRFQATTPAAAPGWTSGGFPMTIDPQLGQPAAGVICWSCLDVGADYAATAGPASGAPLPRVVWRGQADGRVSIQRFAGLAPGRQYRAQLVFFAG